MTTTTFPGSAPLRWTREVMVALLVLAVLTLFRLWYCTYPDIIEDEAYYWLWSNHLDASYYSKGPGIAWTIALGTAIFGDNAFGIRWISVILSAGTGWQLFLLARRLFDERTALTALMVACVVPLLAIGSVLMTIDPLSVFFWVWAANLFCDALAQDRWRDWLLTGFAVGCGFLAKYVNALELLCFLGFLAWSPAHRKHLRNPKALAALGVFVLCTIPVFWWNAHHGWITATHLKERGALQKKFTIRPGEFFQFVTMQAVVISPLLFLGVLISIGATVCKKLKSDSERLLLSLLLPIFGFYSVLALNDNGEANWTATGYIGALILMAADWRQRVQRAPRWRWAVIAALSLAALEAAALHETAPLNLPPKSDPLNRVRGWEGFGQHVDAAIKQHQPQIIIGNRYQVAALIAWYVPGHPQTFVPNADRIQNQFSFWPGYKAEPGATALFVTDELDGLPDRLKQEFSSIRKVTSFSTMFRGKRLKSYDVYVCKVTPNYSQPVYNKTPLPISAREKEVFAAWLKEEMKESGRTNPVIQNQTKLPLMDPHKSLEGYINSLLYDVPRGVPFDLVEDFGNKNVTQAELTSQMLPGITAIVLSASDVDKVFDPSIRKGKKSGWDEFYKRFPNSIGLITFSRVGFSKDGKWALVYVSHSFGSLGAKSCLYVLSRQEDGWKVTPIKIGTIWAS